MPCLTSEKGENMKNNILLIIIVTVIALAIICGVVFVSLAKKRPHNDPNPDSEPLSSVSDTLPDVSSSEPQTEPLPPATEPSESTTATPDISETSEPEIIAPEADAVISLAQSLIGTPFVDNGDTPDGFDNSGFIYYVLRSNGYITCPRGVGAQAAMGEQIDYDKLKAGDLVFFYNEEKTAAGFGGIYIGGGKMVACLMPGTSVKEVDITTKYYRENFYTGISLS